MNEWDLPSLRADRLATTIPVQTYSGETVSDPVTTLFIWRTAGLSKARGMVVGFYTHDERFECLWNRPEHYSDLFRRHGIRAMTEPDFSLWTDAPLVEQLFNVYRMRTLGRLYQDTGIPVIPNLTWSDERSFSFAFEGIPQRAPVVATECRTPGGNDEDRRAFLCGLTEGVKQMQPQHVCIYGGKEHAFWLLDRLPPGPAYHLIDSWTTARRRVRAAQERQVRERNQPNLFDSIGGTERWVEEAQVAA